MSAPFFGKEFTFHQPDGQPFQCRGWGDQHYAVFESLDGFTLVRDPISGYYQYADLTDDGEDLVASGIQVDAANPVALNRQPNLRVTRDSAMAQALQGSGLRATQSRWEERREERRSLVRAARDLPADMNLAPPQRTTTGNIVGLCLVIDFPDVPSAISTAEVEDFCNSPGYSGFGNQGSVRDYFSDNSQGRLNLTNIIAPVYTARHNRSYYTNPAISYGQRTRELIKEALTDLKSQGFDFSRLTADGNDYVYALSVLYAGDVDNNWGEGLWPHAYHLAVPFDIGQGRKLFDYQITNMGAELTLGTFCHELGHLVCDFPDLYDYGNQSRGIGVFCLMCAGGNVDPKNPVQISAYLKNAAGWTDSLTELTPGMTLTADSTRNDFYIFRRSPTEYFIIENRYQTARDHALPGSGLAVWHVDELGSNNHEQRLPLFHYECSLEQADGLFDLELNRDSDVTDLFFLGNRTSFGDATVPDSKWWDGTSSNLELHSIGQAGPQMTFQTG